LLLLSQHGGLDAREFRSYLVFGEPENAAMEDHCVFTDEIMGRSLEQTECVVGSLCLSAFTDPRRSEYVGMGAAFLFAGVKTYIGSLWSVQDIGTAELITKVYNNRFDKNLNWTESLRKAQLTMCGKFRVAG
jgi:CHAT domain-containing protein